MAVLKMCPRCQGTKKVRGIGMMNSECPVCEGLGKVDPSEVKFTPKPAAIPLKRDALPEEYYADQAKQKISNLKDANCAYKNYPVGYEPNKETQNTPAGNKPTQNAPIAPADLSADKLNQVRNEVKPREDNIGMPKVALSASVQAELKAMQDAQKAERASAPAEAEVSEEQMFGNVTAVTVDKKMDVPHIVEPVITAGESNGKKRGRPAKAAQA